MKNVFESGFSTVSESSKKLVLDSKVTQDPLKMPDLAPASEVPGFARMETEEIFDAGAHFREVQQRILEVLNPQALFEQLHPDDQRNLMSILNKDKNPNNRLLGGMLMEEIAKGGASFLSAQPHTPEEVRAVYLEHCARFKSALVNGTLSDDFLLGTKPGDSLATVDSHYEGLYGVSLRNSNKTASLTLAIQLVGEAWGKKKRATI